MPDYTAVIFIHLMSCGREYGTTSLKIHLPQCEKLFIERESLKPKNERRSLPSALSVPIDSSDMKSYNQQAYQQYQNESMITCQWCSRRFADDRIHIHHRSCTQDKPAKRVEETATRTVTGVVQPHRLDALAQKQLASPKSTTTYGKENVTTPKATLKSPTSTRPKTGTLTPNVISTMNKPPISPRSPSIVTSNQPPAATANSIDMNEYNDLKMRVSMLEDQLDMLLSTIGGEENRAQARQATNECSSCGAMAANAYCASCGSKQ